MTDDLKIRSIEVSGSLDRDGEISVTMPTYAEVDVYEWLNKAEAERLVQHLTAVFCLTDNARTE